MYYYTKSGRELGRNFDDSSFATTLLMQSSEEGGGVFEYVPNLQDSSGSGGANYEGGGFGRLFRCGGAGDAGAVSWEGFVARGDADSGGPGADVGRVGV